MAWIERPNLRTLTAKTYRDSDDPTRHISHHVLGTVLHYPTAGPDSQIFDGEVDFTFQHVTAGGRDLYRTVVAGWHYALGEDIEGIFAGVDGTVGFGGRQGAHWLKFRLARVGYIHWPTRDWDDIGGAPSYNRARLTRETDVLEVGPGGAEATLNVGAIATWARIWPTPGGGSIDASWRIEGRGLKEEIVINQIAREWIAANHPPSTPITETWFGFVFRLDVSDIPRWVKTGILQDINGDFNDDGGNIKIRDALDRLLAFMPASVAFSEPYQIGTSEEGEPILTQDRVRLRKRLWRDGDGNHYLLVGARVDQLNQMHAGAITFDPTFDTETAGADKDTYLDSGSQSENFGNATTIEFDALGGTHGLMEFDCSSIPGTATCDSATLYVTRNGDTGGTERHVHVFELLAANEDWGEGDGGDPGGVGEATWDYRDHGNSTAWAGSEGASTADTDFDSTEIGDFVISGGGEFIDPGDRTSTTLTAAAVEDWFGDPNENYGMWMYQPESYDRNIYSSEHGTAGFRPQLVVEYTTTARRIFITHT